MKLRKAFLNWLVIFTLFLSNGLNVISANYNENQTSLDKAVNSLSGPLEQDATPSKSKSSASTNTVNNV